ENSISGLKDYVFQSYVGDGYAIVSNLEEIAANFDLEMWITNAWNVIKLLWQSFGYFTSILFVGAILYTQPRKQVNILSGVLILLLITLGSLAVIFNWTPNLDVFPEIVPQILVTTPYLALIFWFSVYEITTRLG